MQVFPAVDVSQTQIEKKSLLQHQVKTRRRIAGSAFIGYNSASHGRERLTQISEQKQELNSRLESLQIFTTKFSNTIGIQYKKMEEDYHGYLDNRPNNEEEIFAKRRNRSKSLPNNSLLDGKRQTGVKLRLQTLQHQNHQQQQSQDDSNLPRRKSSPLTTPFLQIGMEILSNSARDIEFEKKRMEYVLEKQKRLQEDVLSAKFNRNNRRKSLNIFFGFATDTSSEPTTPLSSLTQSPTHEGTFTKWKRKIQRKVSSGKNLRTAEEGHRRATKAMNAAGEWIVQMEDSLQQEERRLRERALDLRRVSVSAFKLMADTTKEIDEDDDDDDDSDDKHFGNKLVRFGSENLLNKSSCSNANDFDDTFYECLTVDETPDNQKESFVDHLPNDFQFELSLSDVIRSRRRRFNSENEPKPEKDETKTGTQKTLSWGDDEEIYEMTMRNDETDKSELTDNGKRSSLSTLEEYLWTSDSNAESDFVIKEDEAETVI